ncbi:NADH-quinone oxidoreductase subunit J [Parasulfuritortus cantonensis]|uniref:NADH-quinone oxidoreductase subunit J n=1 Tax=Parasulfuritortus cantonensis TaxID=2528202 RepID=A0A4R1BF81_9PROT|nr:NADH-quinone oxidoreductase subunit J [Parasulfuritortus cantonensis]TCJ15811.1 NADH-quinone oxidoreductase subunit J [Parasulfuritortus cantonensis]
MDFASLVFYFFAAILLLSALRVVTAKNPVHAALALVLAFFTAAGIWLLLEAEFLAITLVLVYVGAVMVLFIFVVMMLDINIEEMRKGFWDYLPIAALVAGLMAVEMVVVLGGDRFGLTAPAPLPADFSNTKQLGLLLYTDYVYAFELAAVILLVAIVAAIALTLRRRPNRKIIDVGWQVRQTHEGRIRMVNLKPQKPEAKPVEDDE